MIPDEVEELKVGRVEVVNLDPGGGALFFAEDGVEELGDEDLALSRALRRKGDFDEAARGLLRQESSGPGGGKGKARRRGGFLKTLFKC